MKRFFTATLMLAATVASANSCLNGLSVGVDALYWKPTHCAIPFATNETVVNTTTTRDIASVVGGSDWGVSLHGSYDCDCLFVDLGYTWFESKTTGTLETVTTRLNERYQNVDVRLGADLLCTSCGTLYVYGNARWAEIDLHNRSTQTGSSDLFEQNSRFCAGGPGVGLGAQLPLFCGVGAHLRGGVTAMIGKGGLRKYESIVAGNSVIQLPTDKTQMVPATDFRIGLNYSWWCKCLSITGIVGYELDYYPNALVFSTTTAYVDGLPIAECQDIGFGGLYFGLCISL